MEDIDVGDTDDVNIDTYSDAGSDEEDLQDLGNRFCNCFMYLEQGLCFTQSHLSSHQNDTANGPFCVLLAHPLWK